MARIRDEIEIDRPVDAVFDFVTDGRNEPKYNREMLRSDKLTDGPIGAGTLFRAVHTSARGPVEMIVKVTEFDRPRRMASTTTMTWAEVRGALTFAPSGSGTRMHWEWEVRPKGLAKMLTPVVGVVGRRSERACWEGLKRYLEAESSRASSSAR